MFSLGIVLLIPLLEFVELAVTNTSPTAMAKSSMFLSKSSAAEACF